MHSFSSGHVTKMAVALFDPP